MQNALWVTMIWKTKYYKETVVLKPAGKKKKKKLSEDVTKEQSKGKSFPDIGNSTCKGFHIVLL